MFKGVKAARVAIETNMTQKDIYTFNQQKAILEPKLKRCYETTNTGEVHVKIQKTV